MILVQKTEGNKAKLFEELSRMVQDAHAALTDLRSHNAEQAFRQALALLETTTPKVGGAEIKKKNVLF